MIVIELFFFFFFKQKTAYEMRISDWSSDVCSSDLGMAGCRTVEEVLKRDSGRYRITIFGAEPRVNYNRIMLSPLLAGEKAFEDIVINDHAWYEENGIRLIAGDPVTAIDREMKTLTSRSGRIERYDRLMLATGSDPFIKIGRAHV